jgi:Domain of unknown function (DUF4838)/Carbohydrate family 9 binding domain-like/Glycosyl hydrolase family 67 N-terminus
MKYLLLMLMTTLCITGVADDKFSRKIMVGKKTLMTLVNNGKCNARIVISETAVPVIKFAAKELQNFILESTGVKIPVTHQPQAGHYSIMLGDTAYSRQAGIKVKALPRDGFVIKTLGNKIFIVGRDDSRKNPKRTVRQGMWQNYYERATLFGVYDFLERFLGCRFYFPGKIGTVIPKNKSLTIPKVDIVDVPDYISRSYSVHEEWNLRKLTRKENIFRRLNTYRLRYQTTYIPNCHGLNRFEYLRRFGKSHPEYFALHANGKRMLDPGYAHAGQLCLSSGIVEHICKDIEAYLRGKDAASIGLKSWNPVAFKGKYVNIMPQDAFYLCRCPNCWKHYKQGKQASSDFIWSFFSKVATYVKKRKLNGIITTMAYGPYLTIPTQNIAENIVVKVAERGPWNNHLPEVQKRDNQEILDWKKKLNAKIELWNYANKFGKKRMPGIPSYTPKCIGAYYKSQSGAILGGYMESESDKFIYHYMNYYVWMRVAWNNQINVATLLKEHYQLMYGKAASLMQGVFENFEYKWTYQIMGKRFMTSLGPSWAPASLFEVWEKVYSPAEIKRLDNEFIKALKLTTGNTQAQARIKYMRQKFIKPLKIRSKEYMQRKQSAMSLTAKVKQVTGAIVIDGRLDDQAWQKSEQFTLTPYKDNKQQRVKTSIRLLRQNNTLYVGFKCMEPQMKDIVAGKRPADSPDIWQDNSIEIFLNPNGDKKRYYQFILSSAGVLFDTANTKFGGKHKSNKQFSSKARFNVVHHKDSWTAELAIPLDGMNAKTTFPANFCRNRVLKNAKNYVRHYSWSPFLQLGFHDLDNFGMLDLGDEAKQTNLVKNYNFAGLKLSTSRFFGPWYGENRAPGGPGITYSLDEQKYVSGGQSLKLTNPKYKRVRVSQAISLKPDTCYVLSYAVKFKDIAPIATTRDAGVGINIWDGRNIWLPQYRLKGNMPWSQQTFEFTSAKAKPGKPYNAYLSLFISRCTGTVWFDNIILKVKSP